MCMFVPFVQLVVLVLGFSAMYFYIAFVKYMVGSIMYILALAVSAPMILSTFYPIPQVIRFEVVKGGRTTVLYNTFTLNEEQFGYYLLIGIPFAVIIAALSIVYFERQRREMDIAEQLMNACEERK